MLDSELFGSNCNFFVKCVMGTHLFANNMADNGDGVLLLPRNCFIPIFNPALDRPSFSDQQLMLPQFPRLDTEVTCEISAGSRGRYFAEAWTPTRLWRLADEEFFVIRKEGNKSEIVWEGDGFLELSYRFPSVRWEKDGTIWRSNDGRVTYQITQVFWDNHDHDYDAPPESDPRLALFWLPPRLHNLSELPV